MSTVTLPTREQHGAIAHEVLADDLASLSQGTA